MCVTCPEAKYFPLGETVTQETLSVCPQRKSCFWVAIFSMTTVHPKG